MEKKIFFFIAVLLIFLLGLSLANGAALSCKFDASCASAVIFKISAASNAHAEMPSQANYNNYVCCESPGFAIGNACAAPTNAVVLKLSSLTNAHVEKNTLSNYPNNACLSMPGNTQLNCEYAPICGAGYACISSISADTNAQVADCGGYPTKVCCRCSGTVEGVVHAIDKDGLEVPLQNAKIQIMQNAKVEYGAASPILTDSTGSYTVVDVTCGRYDIIASHPEYVSSTKSGIDLPPQTASTLDFIGSESLVLGLSCESDCTYANDNLIHKGCHGINNCQFYGATAADIDNSKQICDLAQPGWHRDYDPTHELECPSGPLLNKVTIEAKVTCDEGSLIKATKVVKYKGKFVKLVVATCG